MTEKEAKDRELYISAKQRYSIGRLFVSDAETVAEQEREINRYRNKIKELEKTVHDLNMANLDLHIKASMKNDKVHVDIVKMADIVFHVNGHEYGLSSWTTTSNIWKDYDLLTIEAIRKVDDE